MELGTVVVTGATGQVGQWLLSSLQESFAASDREVASLGCTRSSLCTS